MPRRRAEVAYGETAGPRRIVARGRPVAAEGAGQAQGRAAPRPGPRLPGRDHLRPEVRHPVGAAPPGDGLRLRHDLLASPARLAASRRLAPVAPDVAGQA